MRRVPKYEMTTDRFPVFVPAASEGKNGEIPTLAYATLSGDMLVVRFKDGFPATAIQRMLSRGESIGLTFLKVYQEVGQEVGQEVENSTDNNFNTSNTTK